MEAINYVWNLLFSDTVEDNWDREEDHDRDHLHGEIELPDLLNRDGSLRKRQRKDYSRGPKIIEGHTDYWVVNKWPILLRHPDTCNPRTRSGKDFRRKFRVPLPIFDKIVSLCKDTNEPEFCYADTDCSGKPSIPIGES
jgi:hypothetical protein